MATTEQDIHAALMARVETITDTPILWPRKGGDQPAGEHIRAYHMKNDNQRMFFNGSAPMGRMGFIVLTLVSPLGQYQVLSEAKAQAIADVFPPDYEFSRGTFRAIVYKTDIKDGRQEGNRWETPIWIDYRGFA